MHILVFNRNVIYDIHHIYHACVCVVCMFHTCALMALAAPCSVHVNRASCLLKRFSSKRSGSEVSRSRCSLRALRVCSPWPWIT